MMEQEVHDEQNKEWIRQELNPILRGRCFVPSAEKIDQLRGTALLSADTDKIKNMFSNQPSFLRFVELA